MNKLKYTVSVYFLIIFAFYIAFYIANSDHFIQLENMKSKHVFKNKKDKSQ